ncbi:hypothetical protein C8R45DRAFT_916444 [Mycena sanguinolenta]|nr:hypothetical protein C8R45DRAFT_916444 [Mycena sanguinolenta]
MDLTVGPIGGGSGGTGGTGMSDGTGGTGGIGEGPQVAIDQTLFQSPFSTAKVNIANSNFYALAPNVNSGQIALPLHTLNTMDESFSECEIYTNQLMRRKRGFPLYIPGPSESLPEEYRETGIQIGDVGTVTPEGLFDFLFNIYLSADHPININGVPDDFHPLARYHDQRDIIMISHDPGDYVATSLINKVISNAQSDQYPGGDFIFNCRPPQGAVLALPYGAVLKRLKNVQTIQEYARRHAVSWYAYIKSTRGLAVDNGSLYLITGYEKAKSWGLGAYHSTQGQPEFQATFQPIQQNDANPTYRWMGTGWFPIRHKHYNRCSPTNDILNQTVFLHGLSISIREKTSGRLFITTTVEGDVTDIVQSQLEIPTGGNSVDQSQGPSPVSWLLGFLKRERNNESHQGQVRKVILSDISRIQNVR